jgi:hypothetical protein
MYGLPIIQPGGLGRYLPASLVQMAVCFAIHLKPGFEMKHHCLNNVTEPVIEHGAAFKSDALHSRSISVCHRDRTPGWSL